MKAAAFLAFMILEMYGQEFEVASIKPSPPQDGLRIRVAMDGGPGSGDPTTFTCRCSLSMLVMEAYDVKYYQVSGLKSRDSDIYDVAAKVSEGATRAQFQVMLQNLMVERFHIRVHHDVRQMQRYDLTVAKNGPKIKQSAGGAASMAPLPTGNSSIILDQEGFPALPAGRSGFAASNGRARMQGVNETMEQLAARISNQMDLPVIDSTGLNGKYDFSLYWADDMSRNSGPSIFSAIESQLGLKLSPKKALVPIIVLDHIDSAPDGN